jgi:hypothetical protein
MGEYPSIEFAPHAPGHVAFPKIARLNRDIVITEKIDGTNAAIGIVELPQSEEGSVMYEVYAQSRNRIITPGKGDNAGFAAWVESIKDIAIEVLGPGLHFGEWWGNGIQRGYGQATKRFSLFNTARWSDFGTEAVIGVVPVLYEGPFLYNDTQSDGGYRSPINQVLDALRQTGSIAAPGYMNPEGIVIYHTAAHTMFKVTLEGDEKPKGAHPE